MPKGILLVLVTAITLLANAGPASAITWIRTATRTIEPMGTVCGATSEEQVPARSGAFDVRLLDRDSFDITDSSTGDIVAQLQSATPTDDTGDAVPGLTLTYVGSDDLCAHPSLYTNGWFADPVDIEIRYSRAERVRFREYVGPESRYARERPRWIHGGSDFGWAGIRWARWGNRVAQGRGYYYYVDKTTVRYRSIRYPMRFRLSRPHPCSGGLRYLRMETTRTTLAPKRPHVPRHSAINLTCEGGIYGDYR